MAGYDSMDEYDSYEYEQISLDFTALYHDLDDDRPDWIQSLWQRCNDTWENQKFWGDPSEQDDCSPVIVTIREFKGSMYGYIRAGLVAHQARLHKVYESVCSSFTGFCKKFLGLSIWQVERLIKASRVAVKLIANGFDQIPQNESQARFLTTLSDNDLFTAWQKVIDLLPETERTAARIEAIAKELHRVDPDFEGKPSAKRIELDADQWDLLEQKAARYKMSPKKYLELLLQRDLIDEPLPVHPEEATEDDLKPQDREVNPRSLKKPRKKSIATVVKELAKQEYQKMIDEHSHDDSMITYFLRQAQWDKIKGLIIPDKPRKQQIMNHENYQNFVTIQSF